MAVQDITPPSSSRILLFLRLMWSYRWFVMVAIMAVGLGCWQFARAMLGPSVVVDVIRRDNLVQSVVASGHFETPYRVEISSQITGVVADVLVTEGERVKAGQALVRLEASEVKAFVVQAQGALEQAEARVRQLTEMTLPTARETLAGALATLQDAQNTYERTASLNANGYSPRSALDEVQKNLDLAKAQVRTVQLQIFNASAGGSDYVYAQTQVAQARATLDTALSRLSYATIIAPRDGVLIRRSVELGSVAQPGKALLVLAPDGETQLVIDIDERNLGLIAMGQSAIASADAYPEQKFAAKISYINPAIDISRASVQVKLNVPEPPAYLRQDMTVSVDVEVARRDQVLILPWRAVRDGVSNAPWILEIRDGHAYKQPVRLGVRGVNYAEILDGATAGDVAIPIGAGVLVGQRVRALVP
jgi:HlyD family secretion protein